MKKKIQAAVFLLIFAWGMIQMTVPACADPETSSEATTEAEASSFDCSLSSLKIAQASLSPEFAPEQLTYTVTVPHEVTRIALTAETSDPGARKIINGTGDLAIGENIVTVVVTAEDGSAREYRIVVTREESPESGIPGGEEIGSTEETDENTEPQVTEEQTSQRDDGTEESSSESDNPLLETAPVDDGEKNHDSLSGRKLLILVLCIFCLVLLFVIIAALLLRWEPDEADDEEDEPEEDGENDNGNRQENQEGDASEDGAETVTPEELALFYQALNVEGETTKDPTDDSEEPERVESEEDSDDDDLDDDFELLEEDDDFDFLDF